MFLVYSEFFAASFFLALFSQLAKEHGQGIFQEVSYQLSTLANLLNQEECFRLTVMSVCAGELFMIQAGSAWWSFNGKARSPRSEGRGGPAVDPHQRAWCKHAPPDQLNGSGKDEDGRGAASGCDARRWSSLDEDAATCSQRCIAVRADLKW